MSCYSEVPSLLALMQMSQKNGNIEFEEPFCRNTSWETAPHRTAPRCNIYTRSIKVTASIKESRSKAQELQSLFIRLERILDLNARMIEAEEVVRTIVRQLHAFSLSTNLGKALQTSMLEPSLKAHLPEAIGKVGRYYSTTFELVCAARHRNCRLFDSIDVELSHSQCDDDALRRGWEVDGSTSA
jgi:hypothetical protein